MKITETGATVTYDSLPTVLGHQMLLLQVFQNLIGNALKYCDSKPQVFISARPQAGDWCIAIRDKGIGVAPEYHDRVFGLFQRLHTRAKYPGSGIGLATCKRIIERAGGRIWVESALGQGSTFFFTLPKAGGTGLP